MNIRFMLTGAAVVLLLAGCVTNDPVASELPGSSNSYRKPDHTKETHEFLVQGSASEPYKVTFKKDGGNLDAYCTCPAGENRMYCRHRLNILEGEREGIVSPNAADVRVVASWLAGTDVEAAMKTVKELEKQQAQVKRQLSTARETLARSLLH